MNTKETTISTELRKIIFLLITVLFTIFSWIVIQNRLTGRNFSVFITLSTNHGIEKGTSICLKGLTIGSVSNVIHQGDQIVAITHISKNVVNLHQDSLVEINTSGLFSETKIDIIPSENVLNNSHKIIDPFSSECTKSTNLCHLSSIEGEKGLDYNDLIRATTRIFQRLDNPRHANISYLFGQSGIELSRDRAILKMPIQR